jgi:hypothetical protein
MKRVPRGPGVLLRVTYDSIAAAVGLRRGTVQKHGTGKRRRFDPRDLASVASYVASRRAGGSAAC